MATNQKSAPLSFRGNTTKILISNRHLAIEYRATGRLKPDPKNPRRHSEKQVQQIARSIEAFGFNVPLLVDAEMHVVAGHGRLQACQLLGITEVPTISLEHLTEAQARAFMIADNRLTENAEWTTACWRSGSKNCQRLIWISAWRRLALKWARST